MKKFFIIVLFISNSLVAQTIKPLTNYSFENIIENDESSHAILQGCISLYSALTELIKNKYPDLASQFYEMANTLYPYGIISLSKGSMCSTSGCLEIISSFSISLLIYGFV